MRERASRTALAGLLAAFAVVAAPHGMARVVRIVADKTETSAGTVGEIQTITGWAFGELDPKAPGNSLITDIDHAPLNANGMVEYVAKFTLTKPADMTRASGVLWYDLVNRGAPVPPNRGAASPLDDGHVRLISGWQGDIVQTEANWAVQVPVARNPDGSAITGPVLSRTADVAPGTASRPLGVLSYPNPYDAASLGTAGLHLIAAASETRLGETGPATEVAPAD